MYDDGLFNKILINNKIVTLDQFITDTTVKILLSVNSYNIIYVLDFVDAYLDHIFKKMNEGMYCYID